MYENQISQGRLTEALGVTPSTWFESKKVKPEDRRRENKGRPKSIVSKTSAGETVSDVEVISALRTLRARVEFQLPHRPQMSRERPGSGFMACHGQNGPGRLRPRIRGRICCSSMTPRSIARSRARA